MKHQQSMTFDFSLSGAPEHLTRALNIVPTRAAGEDIFVPAPQVTKASTEAWVPWHNHHPGTEPLVFYYRPSNTDGYYYIGVGEAANIGRSISVAGAVRGIPRCGVSTDELTVWFCTDAGRCRLSYEGARWQVVESAVGSMPRLTPRINGTFTSSTGAIALHGMPAAGPQITQAHIATITEALHSLYADIAGSAANSGQWLQPMLAMVKLVDHRGATVAVSPPLLMSAGGWQCTGELQSHPSLSGSVLTIPGLTTAAEAYVIDMEIPHDIDSRAAYAEVWALPQLHPADSTAKAPVRLYNRSDGWHLDAAIPGATLRFADRTHQFVQQMFEAAPHTERFGRCIARVEIAPNVGSTIILRASSSDMGMWSDTYARVRRLSTEATGLTTEASVLSAIAGGAAFTAATMARSGDCLLWGDISVASAAVASPYPYVLQWEESDLWQASVKVTLASGEAVVRHFEFTGHAPLSMLPLVSYPSRDAVTWEIIVDNETAGTRRKLTLPLSPAADGSEWAGYISSGLQPLTLTDTSEPIPAESVATTRRYPSLLLLSTTLNPLIPVASLTCGTAPIDTLIAATRSRSAWDAQRSRFLAFTAGGVTGVSCATDTRYLRAATIDRAATIGATAVTATPDMVVCATHSHLVGCMSNSVSTISELTHPYKGMAWHTAMGRLIALDAAGNLLALTMSGGTIRHASILPLPFTPTAIGTTPDGLVWLATDTELHLLTDTPAQATYTAFDATVTTSMATRPIMLHLGIYGSQVCGQLLLKAHNPTTAAPGRAQHVMLAQLDGALMRPLMLRIASPARRRFTLSFEGTVSADFQLSDCHLIVANPSK